MKISVRGIYSTALIRLLLDEGFRIVKPTKSQKERFGLEEVFTEPEVLITDSEDRHFIDIRGSREQLERLIEVLKNVFEDAIIVWRKLDQAFSHVRVGFPVDSKKKLDEFRARVTYTVPWHHYCRAGGEVLSNMVSFAEDLVEKGIVPPEEMNRMFEEQVKQLTPRLGSKVKIVHVKLDGRRIVLGIGKVVWRSDDEIKILRRIMSQGVYDGLGIPKQIGDTAVTYARRLEWWMKTSYYDFSGNLKGVYYNINLPIAFYPDQIHYFDLELDVVALPNSEPKIIELELLEKAVNNGIVNRKIMEEAIKVAEKIICTKP
ncbi:MAG: DUF402 domain-containing protein [Nitrososphaerota archaeon]